VPSISGTGPTSGYRPPAGHVDDDDDDVDDDDDDDDVDVEDERRRWRCGGKRSR